MQSRPPAGSNARFNLFKGDGMLFDPFGIGGTFLRLQQAWLNHPQEAARAQQAFAAEWWMLNLEAVTRLTGGQPSGCAAVAHGDERFEDEEWQKNLLHCLSLQYYLTLTRSFERTLYDTPGATRHDRRRAAFWARQWFNALAPSNFLPANPVAQRKAWASGGFSLMRGAANLADDLAARDLQMVDASPFKLGETAANTPGDVIFRNDLIELIQYRPLRAKVRAVPLVLVPPWINKYYVLDLNPKKSMIRHLLEQGFTVFAISWKNPGPELADAGFERYLHDGLLRAIETARTVCGVPQVHAVGYCIGGTALAALMAELNGRKGKDMPVAHWTLLASLTDFSRPGEIDAFINEESLATLDTLMAQRGYLDKSQIGWSFRLLRPNSLVWHYFVHKYLYGEDVPAFDVLAWNADSTRLPRALHRFCLHELYMDNKLAQKDALRIDGTPIDLGRIRQPLYAVGADEDHIVPWRAAFKATGLVAAPARFALSTSGHILGIINPPENSKRSFRAGDVADRADGKAWRAAHAEHPGSWWTDWVPWLHERCGALQAPPGTHPDFPPLCAAPGTYVLER